MLLPLLSLAIVLHELGHFLAARLMGVRVASFCLFYDLGFCLFSTGKRFGTEYRIGWLPLGGYVKFADVADDEVPPAWHIRAQRPWRRMVISLAGVAVNLVVAYLCMLCYTIHFVAPADGHYPPMTHIRATNHMMQSVMGSQVQNLKTYLGLSSATAPAVSQSQAETLRRYRSNISVLVTSRLSANVRHMLYVFISLNLILFLFNIIPIPPLDGGQFLMALYEGLFRRPPSEVVQAVITIAGMVALLALFVGDLIHDLIYFVL